MIQRLRDLEIEEDMPGQRRQWIAERCGWIAMGLVLVAAMAGLLGRGAISSATVQSAGGAVTVHYERLARLHAPATLRVVAAPPAEELSLALPRAYLASVQIEHIVPEPATTRLEGEDLVYVFPVASRSAVEVVFRFKMDALGPLEGSVRVDGHPPLGFSQFVYP
jgi:hypothetical protein